MKWGSAGQKDIKGGGKGTNPSNQIYVSWVIVFADVKFWF